MSKRITSIVSKFALTTAISAIALYLGNSSLPRALEQANSQQTRPPDAVAQAQQPSPVQNKRPEQNKSSHDTGGAFSAQESEASSSILRNQPK